MDIRDLLAANLDTDEPPLTATDGLLRRARRAARTRTVTRATLAAGTVVAVAGPALALTHAAGGSSSVPSGADPTSSPSTSLPACVFGNPPGQPKTFDPKQWYRMEPDGSSYRRASTAP